MNKNKTNYNADSIKSLDWKEHIRLRPGMYIGKLGDGSSIDDGIYILIKEIIDNSIDEYIMGYGKKIKVKLDGDTINVRDYGRGIPLSKLEDCVSKINTGGKYDSQAFKKSVGLNGVGTKAVNALSQNFQIESIRDSKSLKLIYKKGEIVDKLENNNTNSRNGTKVQFVPDSDIFKKFTFIEDYIETQILNYVYLNSGLSIYYNKRKFFSDNGLKDLLLKYTENQKTAYPIIHLKDDDIEVAITHGYQYGEEYYSFVNGQNTTSGGTHLAAFREAIVKTVRDYYKKDFDASDIRASIISSISIRIQNPIFESQTKTKLGSTDINEEGLTVRIFINDFIKNYLDNYLHKHSNVAEELLRRILQSEKERKALSGIKKIANQRAKTANLHNKKLRDCKFHYNDNNLEEELRLNTSVFITEGDSASGSITKSRDVKTQAVFSLRGKPLNSYGLTKKIVYENEEFNLLQHALNIENGMDSLRYNQIIIATDADVDGMHIRLLLLTFFLQFYPKLVKNGHIYILKTPLFRVRDKKETIYAYDEKEKNNAINSLSVNHEITRFKGLGEISPGEFKNFINSNIKLEPVIFRENTSIHDVLSYYMGKNTLDRQKFIIQNLIVDNI
ncbi:MAG: DNA topoisomerase IV [Candidatus Marinimicrobia bacterium]|nr:DNA topoisomerase IV [Candidatus Neomarinimicrobiota bacterium]|tara:strand:- start:32068 stop:33915 length:1848 start_codon:yes stop_codon:yes gene_type:complete